MYPTLCPQDDVPYTMMQPNKYLLLLTICLPLHLKTLFMQMFKSQWELLQLQSHVTQVCLLNLCLWKALVRLLVQIAMSLFKVVIVEDFWLPQMATTFHFITRSFMPTLMDTFTIHIIWRQISLSKAKGNIFGKMASNNSTSKSIMGLCY